MGQQLRRFPDLKLVVVEGLDQKLSGRTFHHVSRKALPGSTLAALPVFR